MALREHVLHKRIRLVEDFKRKMALVFPQDRRQIGYSFKIIGQIDFASAIDVTYAASEAEKTIVL